MNTCLIKYFGGVKITRNEVNNLLKNLLCVCTVGELEQLENKRELPPCLLLLVRALFRDVDDGQCDTLMSIMDTVF